MLHWLGQLVMVVLLMTCATGGTMGMIKLIGRYQAKKPE